jgi:hypothetical protein
MFDSVMVKCPGCGQATEYQSNSGPCGLQTYTLETAPIDVMAEFLVGCGWTECHKCKTEGVIRLKHPPEYVLTAKQIDGSKL